MTTATDDVRDHLGLPCEPGLICPSHVEIEDLTVKLAAAESRAARAEAALREIADDGCQSAADHDGRDCKTRNQTVPVGYCYPCMAALALTGQEVGR